MGKKLSKKKQKLKDKKIRTELLKVIIEDLINKQSSLIIDLIEGKKHVNEFIIAKKLKLTINQTRNILYKLLNYGIVSFTRKKDKKKGWYIYFWTLNPNQAIDLLESNLKKKLESLELQLKNRKETSHYFCEACSIEVNQETALLNNFTCTECNGVYKLEDNTKIIEEINKEIAKVKKELELVFLEKEKELKVSAKKTRTEKPVKKIKKTKNTKTLKKKTKKLNIKKINRKKSKTVSKKRAKRKKRKNG